MKIVIDIPEDNFKRIRELAEVQGLSDNLMGYSLLAIAHGIVLPKGHGDLIDRNILLQNWKVIPSRDRLIFDRYIQTLNGVIPADK